MNGAGGLAVYLAALLVLTAGTVWRPALALAAVVCIFGLKQLGQVSHPWLQHHSPFTNLMIGSAVLASLLIQVGRGNCMVCRTTRTTWVALTLFGFSAISLLWTPRLDLAAPIWWDNLPYIGTMVVLAPITIRDAAGLRAGFIGIATVGGTILLYLLVFGTWARRGLVVPGDLTGDETNPLAIAGLGGAVVAASLYVTWAPREKVATSLFRLATAGIGLAAIVRSGSRGQLLAILLAVLLTLPVAFRIRQSRGVLAALLVAAALAGGLVFAWSEYAGEQGRRWSESSATEDVAGRFDMAFRLLDTWQQSGLTLVLGLGNSAAFDPRIIGIYPHIVPLEVLGEEGLIGLALYVWFLWLVFGSALRALRAAGKDPAKRGLLAAVAANTLLMFIVSLKEGNMIGSVFFFLHAQILSRMPMLLGNDAVNSVPLTALQGARLRSYSIID